MLGGTVRGAFIALIGAALASCRSDYPTQTPKVAAEAHQAPAVATAARRPPVWVVSAASLRRHRMLAPRPEALPDAVVIDGLRISHPGGAIAEEVAEPPLVGGIQVPVHLGGGHLFWSGAALYRARSLLGKLEPIVALTGVVRRVSFGPKLALVHTADGGRRAIELPTGRVAKLPLPGLVDVVSAGPNAHLAITDPERVLISVGKGGWKERLSLRVQSLHPGEGEAWIEDDNGRAFRLGADGSFAPYDRVPKRPPAAKLIDDPRWPLNDETPLERAVRRGVRVGERWALVDAAGAIAKVDLDKGELVEIGRRILPDRAVCRLLSIERDVVATCVSDRGAAFVASGLDGAEPRIEKTFPGSGTFHFAGGSQLVFSGACTGNADEKDAICVRGSDARWQSLALRGADPNAAIPVVGRWIPTRDGGAVGVVVGATPGLIVLPGGKLSPFTDKAHESITRFARPTAVENLVDDAMLTEAGDVRLFIDDGAVLVRKDGKVERSPYRTPQLARSGAFALGRDDSGRLWQTTNWGATWQAAAGPPTAAARPQLTPRRCSPVGCDLESWYRIGYPIDAEQPRKPKTAPPAARHDPGPAIGLECSPTAPASVTALPANADATHPSLDLGARRAPAGVDLRSSRSNQADSPRVVFLGVDRETEAGPRVVGIRLLDALALRPTVRSARPPTTLVLPSLLDADGGTVLPVASGASTDGWVVPVEAGTGSIALWVRADRPLRVVALGATELTAATSSVARGDELLLLTGAGSGCAEQVLSVGARGSTPVFQLPRRPSSADCPVADAIALTSTGEIGAIRFPSGSTQPSSDDPALLFRANAAPVLLAPWAKLQSADAAACTNTAADDVRALIVAPAGWLGLTLSGDQSLPEDLSALALVRWSATRVCLEAVELDGAPEIELGERSLAPTVVARFGSKTEAARRGVDFGLELHEPLACRLVSR